MQRETVRHRQWLDDQRFLDLVGAVNLIPGPNAAERAIYLGQIRAGGAGCLPPGRCLSCPECWRPCYWRGLRNVRLHAGR